MTLDHEDYVGEYVVTRLNFVPRRSEVLSNGTFSEIFLTRQGQDFLKPLFRGSELLSNEIFCEIFLARQGEDILKPKKDLWIDPYLVRNAKFADLDALIRSAGFTRETSEPKLGRLHLLPPLPSQGLRRERFFDSADGSLILNYRRQSVHHVRAIRAPDFFIERQMPLLGSGLDQFNAAILELLNLFLRGTRTLLRLPSNDIVIESREHYNQLISKLARNPRDFHKLSTRQFEELIAELLLRDGFDVHLTKQTRDGGVDILATKQERFGPVLFAYECKKHRADRPVTVGIVRQLVTAASEFNAALGVLCTTSYFTPDAIALASRKLIYPQDHVKLHEWVMAHGK